MNLDFGTIRIKSKGSDGGHNGLKDITQILNTSTYPRFRFGNWVEILKKEVNPDYVLSKWNDNEISEFISLESSFIEIIKSFIVSGIDVTMNKFNG